MRRVLVVGMSGAGKTTAARRVGAKLGLPFHEMDALALGPNWSQPPGLVDEVKRITAEPAWIFDSWGYPAVRDLMWQSADTILWLDYPATVVLPRLIRRSVIRTATNAELFGGNRETLREWLSPGSPGLVCGGHLPRTPRVPLRPHRPLPAVPHGALHHPARVRALVRAAVTTGKIHNHFYPERSRDFV